MKNKNNLSVSPAATTGLELQSDSSLDNSAATGTPSTTVGGVKTSVHVTALDGIVNVNSLFTMAIFIGFSLTVPENAAAVSRAECTTSRTTVRRLIVFEVVSFSFFLFSSLVAQSLKLTINLLNNMDPGDPHKADVDPDLLRYGLFGSAVGSVMGCAFLMLSIMDFVRVKLGDYSCGGEPVIALVALVIFVGPGLFIYMATAVYASFFIEVSSKNSTQQQQIKQN
ncbi:hypothetical protein ACS0TY_007942 [Phlomoides rotata]